MEDTLIASYITLIIGYLIIENKVTFYTPICFNWPRNKTPNIL